MTVDLQSAQGTRLDCGTPNWRLALDVAKQHGWTPEGTQPPDEFDSSRRKWDGSYLRARGQRVTASDAKNLGAALHRAIHDGTDLRGRLWMSGIVSLCEKGAFAIY